MVIRQSIRRHYESSWGIPDREAQFELAGNLMEVYKWDVESTDEGVALYATNGSSGALNQPYSHRVEFYTGFILEFDDIASTLSLLGHYPLSGNGVTEGDTVTLGEPLWKGAQVRTWLIMPLVGHHLDPLELPDSSHVHFYRVLPISEAELQLKKQHGAKWLIGQLNDVGIETWHHDRRYL